MKKILSEKFYSNLNNIVLPGLEGEANKKSLKKVDWEYEANKCITSLTSFFGKIDAKILKENDIDTIGVIDICWNEYGSDIEVDFMPENDFETAFDQGCIMNNSAIDNDHFFKTYFNTDGEKAFDEIGDDYQEIILAFYYLIHDIIEIVTQQKEFIELPKKSPIHIGFALFHDEERTNIISIEKK